MANSKYLAAEEMIRRELAENKGLSTEQRMELLGQLTALTLTRRRNINKKREQREAAGLKRKYVRKVDPAEAEPNVGDILESVRAGG